jgi:NAD(P)-dependent dehydrogenase (short-subunit alcohol dehydrogenase family)
MQVTWEVTRAVASAAFLERQRPGRVVYIAPGDDREHAQEQLYARAARAALENLARTLSIEFSRHAVTTVAIAPGTRTSAQEIAALVAYLASPAGAYFSGCLLDLTGPTPASRASERAR